MPTDALIARTCHKLYTRKLGKVPQDWFLREDCFRRMEWADKEAREATARGFGIPLRDVTRAMLRFSVESEVKGWGAFDGG